MLKNKEKQVQISTLIGKGSELMGDFSVEGSARIDGKVDGNVTVTGTLIVGSNGKIAGDVTAKAVVIGGEVLGDIIAPEKTELTATAKVLGDVTTQVIVIDENAVFQGKCDMNQEAPEKKAKGRMTKPTRGVGRKSAKAAIAEALKEVKEAADREEEKEEALKEDVSVQANVAPAPEGE